MLRRLLLLLLATGCAAPELPPDLVLVTVDTLRADILGFAGGPARTPHIDRLAATGTVFGHASTPLPRTTPAVASLLTGRWPNHHGSRDVGEAMQTGRSLAEILRDAGYATLAVSANAAAGPEQALDAGFERFVAYPDLVARFGNHLDPYALTIPDGAPGSAAATTRAALDLVDEIRSGRPLFLWVLYLDPHFLYLPPRPLPGPPGPCQALYAHYTAHRSDAGEIFSDVGGVSSAALEECRRLYRAEVEYTDREIGRLVEGLTSRGRWANAMVAFTADHGENLGEGGLYYEHGNNLHRAGVEVPLVLRGPGIPAGERRAEPVSLVDLVPTLLGRLGRPELVPDGIDGVDLFRTGPRDAAGRQRIVFSESGRALWNEATDRLVTGRPGHRQCVNGPRFSLCRTPGAPRAQLFDHEVDPRLTTDIAGDHPDEEAELAAAFPRWDGETARLEAAFAGRFKLLRTPRLDGGFGVRLFDVIDDPEETRDLSLDHPALVRRLTRALEEWRAGTVTPTGRGPSPEVEESLRALGYLD